MTATMHSTASAGELDEDEVLLAWLKASYSVLTTAERRAAVRRLCNEFGYTTAGLARLLGLSDTMIGNLRASDEQLERIRAAKREQARRSPKVSARLLLQLTDQWQDRAAAGLSAAEATQLLAELRALTPAHLTSERAA